MMMLEEKEKKWWLEEAEKLGYTIHEKEIRKLYDAPKIPPSRWDLHSED